MTYRVHVSTFNCHLTKIGKKVKFIFFFLTKIAQCWRDVINQMPHESVTGSVRYYDRFDGYFIRVYALLSGKPLTAMPEG